MFKKSFASGLVLVGSAFLAACQTGGAPAEPGSRDNSAQGEEEPIRESELRAFCPSVSLRDGTAYFRTYRGNAEGDPDQVVYQASISDTTRSCDYREDATVMTVGVAGKIVPGPQGRTGTITMPIRVVAVRGDEVLYSELHQHSVAVEDTSGATQFLYIDNSVVIPGGVEQGTQIIVGYDEGPYNS